MTIKYPIRKYLGKYESWLLHLYGRKSMLFNDRYLELFFNHFPKVSGLEQFGTPDIEEFRRYSLSIGVTIYQINQTIKCLERFFRYLIEVEKISLTNPGRPFIKHVTLKHIVRRKKDSLRLNEYRRLLDFSIKYEPNLVYWLTGMVEGKKGVGWMTNVKAARMLKRVAVLAAMPHVTMRYIQTSLRNGLWREIIHDWSNRFLMDKGHTKLNYPYLNHVQLDSNSMRNIEVSACDIRPSISDSSNNPLSISGIDNMQQRPEP